MFFQSDATVSEQMAEHVQSQVVLNSSHSSEATKRGECLLERCSLFDV